MRNPRSTIEQITASLADAIPGGLGDDLRQNLQGALRAAFDRMDLVTREEFEVQEAVLRRTREKLERLESQVKALEETLAGQ